VDSLRDVADVDPEVGFPDARRPSDHLPLVATIAIV
jgi:hypothetical protein